MEEMNIKAVARTGEGVKGALSKIRAEKNIPAVVYGGHKEPVSITISLKDLEKIIKAGKNTIVSLDLPTGKEQALVKEVQYHVVSDLPIHADFQRVSLKDKMDVVVPVKLVGESAVRRTSSCCAPCPSPSSPLFPDGTSATGTSWRGCPPR